MKNKVKNKKNGFTLVEILFAMAIFVLIMVALSLFSKNLWTNNDFVSAGLVNADTERQLLQTMVSEIRTANTANTGAYAISQATATSFTFYSDINNDGLEEEVRYFLNGTTLQKGVTEPTGSPLTYNLANEKISTLALSVTNLAFAFYDTNYDGTTAALTFPVNIPDIRLVKITVTMTQNRSPSETFFTQVSLRNLKDNL